MVPAASVRNTRDRADVPGSTYFNPVFKHNGMFVKTKGYCTDVRSRRCWAGFSRLRIRRRSLPSVHQCPAQSVCGPAQISETFYRLGFNKNSAGFYGMIEHIDDCMGAMFNQLEASGLMENTIIIFTSDNGMTRIGCGLSTFEGRPHKKLGTSKDGKPMMSYNAEMKGLKGTVDEGGVPFIVLGRGVQGQNVDTVAILIFC